MGAVTEHWICVVDVSVYVCDVHSTILTFKNGIFWDMTSLKPLDTNMWIWRTFEHQELFKSYSQLKNPLQQNDFLIRSYKEPF